jgi:hypothetical protein
MANLYNKFERYRILIFQRRMALYPAPQFDLRRSMALYPAPQFDLKRSMALYPAPQFDLQAQHGTLSSATI